MTNCSPPAIFPRPFLKWAGGKGRLIQQYSSHFPKYFDTYYEPFLGGGAIFFYLAPPRAVLTDINPELVNVYHCIRDDVNRMIDLLSIHQRQHCREYYYQVRSAPGKTDLERAARLIYLNKTCFNGLYRENSRGEFNVPMGKYTNPRVCDPELLRAASFALKTADLTVNSFDAILELAKTSRDFVYFDPPYYPISSTSSFTAYSRHAFSQLDQIRLRDVFVELANRGVKVMLSNSDCSFIRGLYSDFNIHPIIAARAINCNAAKRGKINEVLVTSY
ncbi:DNA adenine methylase [Oculatella sp. LEGE 06141]|uniref:DNA adenine methylase n=1 Tax=Oculatella sp. LEGE 06141 TaxID=1828648 RepID=UPI00187E2788|nr:DNA adenine methylase [Oculatella sp. LEGE 06141]MBE9182600.1 DNA adenine methylase [Oculatella sp. LEGE 06141]